MTRPLRILAVTSQFPLAGEPTRGRPLHQTLQALSRNAMVRVASPVARYPARLRPRSYVYRAADDAFQPEGCNTTYVHYPTLPMLGRMTNGMACARALKPVFADFRPDVVLAYWLYPDAFGAMQVAREARVPVVVGARGSDLRVRDALSRQLTRPVVAGARRLLVVSQDLARVAIDRYRADPERIRVIPNGCDTSVFRLQSREDARARLGLAPGVKLIVYVGRLVPEKGLGELLAAMQRLPSGEWLLAMVGDGPMRDELERIAARSPVPVLFPGSQSPQQVAGWMAASDVVTLPSYSEGHPNVLVEALACGRPVVATDVGGIPEVVDADSGRLVPLRDVDALARALADVVFGEWDEQALSGRFARSWETVADETLTSCLEAIEAGHG